MHAVDQIESIVQFAMYLLVACGADGKELLLVARALVQLSDEIEYPLLRYTHELLTIHIPSKHKRTSDVRSKMCHL